MSGGRRVVVLMEDQLARGQTPHGHGPALLLKACLADRLEGRGEGSFWEVLYGGRLRDGVLVWPCKGDTEVRRACCEELDRYQRLGSVVAMVDRDKLHRPLKVRGGACRVELLRAFLGPCPRPEEVEVVLLEDNMETVLRVVADLLREDEATRERAIRRKDLNARDAMLQRLATDATRAPERDELCARVASWGRLVERVLRRLLGEGEGQPAGGEGA